MIPVDLYGISVSKITINTTKVDIVNLNKRKEVSWD